MAQPESLMLIPHENTRSIEPRLSSYQGYQDYLMRMRMRMSHEAEAELKMRLMIAKRWGVFLTHPPPPPKRKGKELRNQEFGNK